MDKDILDRFMTLEACSTQDIEQFYISEDWTIGLLKEPNHEEFISLGKYKLKSPRVKSNTPIYLAGLYFNVSRLYRILRVFGRRKKFEIGLYPLHGGYVYAFRERGEIILLAPLTVREDIWATPIDFSQIVTKPNLKRIKEVERWMKILKS